MVPRLRSLAAPLATGLLLLPALAPPAAHAAEQVVFVSGAFRRSIPVADLAHLAETGEARGLLGDVLRLGRQNPAELAKLLNVQIRLPLVLTSRLLGTRIGEAALNRVARIVFPLKAPGVAVPALRAATILGLEKGDGSLSPLGFLQAYPNQDLAVSLPQLRIAFNRLNSVTDVVRGFLETDLGGQSGAAGNGTAP
ncbi:alpha/beta hydrolase [Synechococcus sp. CCY9202]|uniref:alpha/beta hydrolase n=1 Tax=Synechococcus sp. CCY9202 TaxID=174698 RepID=UPI002B22067B|nr:alpha/beta hydrolase [Synechococcus sp. CCY9202]MEA5423277.1 alpha/beta hydrolase [Synechococcus sp. CCY9202]